MRHTRFWTPILLLGGIASPLLADTLVLSDGKRVNGTFLGGTTRHVEFLLTSGQTITPPVDTIKSLTFSSAPPAPTTPAKPAQQKSARPPIVIPAGTLFRVRTIDGIDVDAAQAGARFRGSLDDPIMPAGDVIVPRGADVVLVAAKVEQGGRMKGSDLIELKVNSITVN